MIKIKNNTATREPIPNFLPKEQESLADLSWTDPLLGVNDCAWWPEEDQSLELGQCESYGDENFIIDNDRKVVIVKRDIIPWTAEKIALDKKLKVPQSIPMLNAQLMLIEAGWMPDVKNYLNAMTGINGEQARVYFDKAQTMKRNHPFVLEIPEAIGKTEEEVDNLFIDANNMNI